MTLEVGSSSSSSVGGDELRVPDIIGVRKSDKPAFGFGSIAMPHARPELRDHVVVDPGLAKIARNARPALDRRRDRGARAGVVTR